MTEELKDALTRRLEEAVESGDPKEIQRAHTAIDKAMMDCQLKTATRVKQMYAKIDEVCNMIKGAKIAARIMYAVGGAGGGALLMAVLKEIFGK